MDELEEKDEETTTDAPVALGEEDEELDAEEGETPVDDDEEEDGPTAEGVESEVGFE